jgi:hypothetical protein
LKHLNTIFSTKRVLSPHRTPALLGRDSARLLRRKKIDRGGRLLSSNTLRVNEESNVTNQIKYKGEKGFWLGHLEIAGRWRDI